MKLRFTGTWTAKNQAGVPKGVLALAMSDEDRKKVGAAIKKLADWQEKNGKEKDLDVSVEYYYKKRTLDMNNLVWALYGILANEMNQGKIGEGTVASEDLYKQDVQQYAAIASITVPAEYVKWVREEYHYIDLETTLEGGFVELRVRISTSHMNTIQCHKWVEMLFDRIAMLGVSLDQSADIKKYWTAWKQDHGDKWSPSENILTGAEYKAAHRICEATGDYLITTDNTGKDVHVGHLAHIKARGMGGDPEGVRDREDNFLVLSGGAHRRQHDKGWETFLAEYPWLKTKVEAALNRPVEAVEQNKEDKEEIRDDLF